MELFKHILFSYQCPVHIINQAVRRVQTKMFIHVCRGNSASWCTHQIALLDQLGFYNIFNGIAFFSNCSRQVLNTYRPTVKCLDNGKQQTSVHYIKTERVNL